jgi:hypothetical protein
MSMLNKINKIIETNGDGDILYKKWDVKFRDDYFSEVYWSYFPSTQKYFFEGNPAFSYEYRNLFDVGRYPITTFRDGFAGLLEFFLIHPVPTNDFRSILLIHKKFQSIVPKQWKEFVACYSINPRSIKKETDKKELIIHGLGLEECFWKESPLNLVKRLKLKTEGFEEIKFLIPQRESLMSSKENQEKKFNVALLKAIYEVFGFDVKIETNTEEFLEKFKSNNFSFINLDSSNGFIADSYIDHHFFSIGGNSLNEVFTDLNEGLSYNLSHHHKITIEEIDHSKSIFSTFYMPHKLSGRKKISVYDVYQSKLFQKLFIEHF